ncbi:hypothetical protein PC129_g21152 [Phytophthora cactorum]|uniref:Ankyrin repeat-containing domain n=1 Tax=Phytophthora cactorum TaxID=29920 RepID=A0A329RDI8_9STRA|nr:hypothetical protein PC111_g21419 [Phytophthora cactorum]KAG2797995.1 hypothetical protein PC112_g21544 [Phytophthora cactorum]KAG2826379.1 hypothetical protein PC113_g21777 [Phytophthora cactorum]KAG2876275.1 hypothetical protein PC114_g24274 [Phytophthora cactorum]KAG2890660.1 hypothetical protein PC115_g19435 [Phytophthora cactorum]
MLTREVIGTAFVRAATSGYADVVAALHDGECVTTMTRTKALICATYHDHASIVEELCSKSEISTETIARALETAATRGSAGVVKVLCSKHQLAPELVAKIVEEEAIDGGSARLIETLYDQQYTYMDPIADGIVNAALKDIYWVTTICNEERLSSEILGEVFLKAACRGSWSFCSVNHLSHAL